MRHAQSQCQCQWPHCTCSGEANTVLGLNSRQVATFQITLRMSLPNFAVLDGGFGTECVRHGHKYLDSDPLWSVRLLSTDISFVQHVHTSFLEAGADIIGTNTYQASIEGVMTHLQLSQDQASHVITAAVDTAKSAVKQYKDKNQSEKSCPLVAGSIGPYGACRLDGSEYTGSYIDSMTKQDLMRWHRPRLEILVRSGVDLLAMETIPAQKEAEALVAILKEHPTARAWITFSCKDAEHTCHGELIEDAVRSVVDCKQVIGVGVNCTSPQYVSSLISRITPVSTGKILVVYPNSGEEWTAQKTWQGRDNCQPLAEYVAEWLELGAQWIGGCCRTTSCDIKEIATVMQRHTSHKL